MDMIDVVNKKCVVEGCNTRPSFNYQGNQAIYCACHKANGMIQV